MENLEDTIDQLPIDLLDRETHALLHDRMPELTGDDPELAEAPTDELSEEPPEEAAQEPEEENPEESVEASGEELPEAFLEEILEIPGQSSPQTQESFVGDMDILYPPVSSPSSRKRVRPELIMGIIAGLAAALLLVVVVLCLPYFGSAKPSEDPELLLHQSEEPEAIPHPTQETILEPTVPETEPEEPTIPPDPNPYNRYDFQYNRYNYLLLQNLDSSPGVDVSAFQGDINWTKVARSGIEFAIIRLGYRGYETGKLVEDEYAKKNLKGAADAGLNIGAYFFSQALTTQEAQEEIDFMLEVLGETYLDMPIILDWEIPAPTARSANMDARTLTDIQLYFCEQVEKLGYQPMIYFNWHQSENLYYLHELEGAPFWLALYQDRMTYPWKVEMWQYTDRGRVPGINGNVDLNVYMPGP